MQVTRGKIAKAQKFCVYGVEGIGKSTFAAQIPGVVFIDTEGSTGNMDVPRLPTPSSWQMLLDEAQYVNAHPQDFGALVIDTADWAERLCMDHVCAKFDIKSLEEPGYGKGYVYLYEEFGRLLNILTEITAKGVHAGFTAHAMMRKFEQPDEAGAYDRWELKMTKKVAPLVKEWADIVLFANYKTLVYAADKEGKKHKAAGGQRVMYATHHPCWDAKNRFGLPDEMPFEFAQVAGIFAPLGGGQAPQVQAQEALPIPETAPAAPPFTPDFAGAAQSAQQKAVSSAPAPVSAPPPPDPGQVDYTGVPPALQDLMRQDGITPFEVRAAVAQKGYFPMETPFANFPADFVGGVLIGAWPQVRQIILDNRQNDPF